MINRACLSSSFDFNNDFDFYNDHKDTLLWLYRLESLAKKSGEKSDHVGVVVSKLTVAYEKFKDG